MEATTKKLAVQSINRLPLSLINSKGNGLPNRTIIHALEGLGKSSFAAQMKAPIFIETKGETGLETLIDSGRLPEIPHFPEVQSWPELLGCIETLTVDDHTYKTLVIDTANGAERLCHEHVCDVEYGGEWGDRGFGSYAKGFEVSLAEWRKLLNALDALRATKSMAIVLLCHTKVKTFKNPDGHDYDRYAPDMHDKTWGLSHKWADLVLFGNFETLVVTAKGDADKLERKGKAAGGQVRMLYTERHASYDAKNRLGLPEEIEMGNSPQEAFANFIAAVKSGRARTLRGMAGAETQVQGQ